MKTSLACLAFAMGTAVVAIASNQALITFDDLLPQSNAGLIPNGYANLEWDSFGVLDPQGHPGVSVGYPNAVLSLKNVAFNAYANSDGTTTGGFRALDFAFDLNSAHLTAAWNDGLQVRVIGFAIGVPIYDNTFTFDTSGPSLVNFNYLGIDRVEFISYGGLPHGNPGSGGTQVAIDNLVISVPEPSTVSILLFGTCLGWSACKNGRGGRNLL
jgi:hypothetical protein